jgi:hypothetical protein
MSRLKHSAAGFARGLQISRNQIWIVVEGLIDRAFYSGICEQNNGLRAYTHDIALSQELPGAITSGKRQAMIFYRYLRRRKLLSSDLGGKKSCVLFFLDKDLDDVLRTAARTSHVVYTEFYTVENYLFRFGNLRKAVVAAASLDNASVSAVVPEDQLTWARRVAASWKEWIVFSYFVMKHKLNAPSYGSNSSPIHLGAYGLLDGPRYAVQIARLETLLGVSHAEFIRLYESVTRKVEELLAQDSFDSVFNGKWYKWFLVVDARNASGGRKMNEHAVGNRLHAALFTTLDFSQPWSKRFGDGIDYAITQVS